MAFDFNGSSQDLDYTLSSTQLGGTSESWSFWLYPDSVAQYRRPIHLGGTGGNRDRSFEMDDGWGFVFNFDFSTDGRIAELAIWDVDIGSSAFAALAGGDHPLTVNFSDLVLYLSIYGDNSPEPDYFDKTNATVTGSLPKATHPTMDAPPAQSNPRYLIQGSI